VLVQAVPFSFYPKEEMMSLTRKILYVILLLLTFVMASHAQTVGPLVAEGGKGRAKGEFTVTNNGVQPMLTVVEAHSFKLTSKGGAIYLPLDERNVVVKLNETSAKIGPRQNHTFSYQVECLQTPCLVALLPRMITGLHTAEGMQVGIIIPHSIYLCDKAKGCRASVRLAAGIPAGQ
jgi:hypothetical protein